MTMKTLIEFMIHELAEDEEFVQGLANGLINSDFDVKVRE